MAMFKLRLVIGNVAKRAQIWNVPRNFSASSKLSSAKNTKMQPNVKVDMNKIRNIGIMAHIDAGENDNDGENVILFRIYKISR